MLVDGRKQAPKPALATLSGRAAPGNAAPPINKQRRDSVGITVLGIPDARPGRRRPTNGFEADGRNAEQLLHGSEGGLRFAPALLFSLRLDRNGLPGRSDRLHDPCVWGHRAQCQDGRQQYQNYGAQRVVLGHLADSDRGGSITGALYALVTRRECFCFHDVVADAAGWCGGRRGGRNASWVSVDALSPSHSPYKSRSATPN